MIGMTVCSGIGAPEVAAPWIDWKYQSEIEKFPCAVLAERFHDAVNLVDMTKFKEWPDADINVLCGGTPCQSFSVAGLRKGLADPRGNLMLTYLAIAARYQPEWLVWENVPGVLSSNGGRDFGTFLGALGQLGYGFAYRVLDAQYFGVAQRRRRVFVVGYLRDWRRAAAVLFERESLSGHPAPRRSTGEGIAADVAPSLVASGRGVERIGDTRGQDPVVVHPLPNPDTCGPLTAGMHKGPRGTEAVESNHIVVHGTQDPITSDVTFPLGRNQGQENAVCVTGQRTHALTGEGFDASEDGTGRGPLIVPHVRRLTPTECERLQGFPDGHTLIRWRGKAIEDCPDGPRYKALGNSMAVPVMGWIFDRIRWVAEFDAGNPA